MRNIKQIIFLSFLLYNCKDDNKIYYFYNTKNLFSYIGENSNDSIAYKTYEYSIKVLPLDSFSIEGGCKVYGLNHYYKFSGYRDTFFVKPKAYLDSIHYFGKEWFQKEENLDLFWETSQGWLDSLKIYTIEPLEGTDSIIFRRVHRYYYLNGG